MNGRVAFNEQTTPQQSAAIRQRLRNPPNAVEDMGINLTKLRPPGVTGYPPPTVVPDPTSLLVWSVKRTEAYIVPEEYRWSALLGCEPQIPKPERYVTPRHVLMAVAKVWDIDPRVLTAPDGHYFALQPRFVMMGLARHLTNKSYAVIGQAFSRNHTCIQRAMKYMRPHLEAVGLRLGESKDPLKWAQAMQEQTGGVF